MESRECQKLWENDGEHKPLRRPNVERSEGAEDPKSIDQILSTSILSADAKEWFPRGYVPQIPSNSVQDRLKKIKSPDASSGHPEETSAVNLAKMQSILRTLTYDPGQFDILADKLVDLLEPHFQEIEPSDTAADMIFQFALNEPSFRYNGARLCSIIDEQYPYFRSRLHLLCEKELIGRDNLQGLTLFLAELYMQLNYQSIYGKSLLLSIENLLKSGKEDDIKCICQTLKLTGYSLEETHSEALDKIFTKLEELKPTMSQSIVNILGSTVHLRRNHWGRNTGSATTNSTQEQNGYISSSEADLVFYGPDGQEISSEEQEFLCANIDDYLGDESSDPDDLFDPEPEMDAEIREAFREFVKMGKR